MKPFTAKKHKEVKYRDCRQCDTRFKITREWKIFCTPQCRFEFHNLNRNRCFYCDGIATETDHVWASAARPHARDGQGKRSQEKVPCCRECNHILGSEHDETFEDRITRLFMKFAAKHALLKPATEWAPTELVELGPSLRQHVKARLAKRRQSERRLVYMVGVRDWWRRTHNEGS